MNITFTTGCIHIIRLLLWKTFKSQMEFEIMSYTDISWNSLRSSVQLDVRMRDYCVKASCAGPWFPVIPQTEPSIKREPDTNVGFSLMLLTILNPLLSLLTHSPSCAAHRPPLSPRPSNDLDFYYLGWWDIHKETLCQQDGKHVSCSVLMCLLERSFKSNSASGSPLCSLGGHSPASSGWGKLVRNVWCDRFIDGSLLY